MIEDLGTNLVPVLAITCLFLFLVIWVVAATLDSLYKTRCNTQLKQRMVERGASAHEIDQVLKAGNQDWEQLNATAPPVKSFT